MRLLAALLAAALMTATCDGDDVAEPDARRTPSARPTPATSAPARPGELDVARSEDVTSSVRACARDQKVRLDDLKVRVDSDGVLIGIGYRAVDAASGFEDVVERCLRDAGVVRPATGG
ncbi:MAG TPA: hypothetical protein VHJ34_07485 [Actinomycetota bacterium]|nr:hypothetical protein [Actinomycetota bacterium]